MVSLATFRKIALNQLFPPSLPPFFLENSLLGGGTSILVYKRYDVCPFRFVYLNDPGTDQNVFFFLSFVYCSCLENVNRYIASR